MRLLPVAAAALLAAGCASSTPSAAPAASYRGVIPQESFPRPDFTLTDTSGKSYDFFERTKGKATLLYFGYTHCPDECPAQMHDVKAALDRVPDEVADRVEVVFVTTDPRRDTRRALRRWLDEFDPRFVGLVGTEARIHQAEEAAHVPLSEEEQADPAVPFASHTDSPTDPHSHASTPTGGYSVSHAAVVLAYSAADRNPVLYPSGVSVDDIAADLPLLVKES